VSVNFFYTLGRIEVCFLAYISLENFEYGNWRLLLFLTCLPNFLCYYLNYLYLDDTPSESLLKVKDFQKTIEVINKMG